MKKFHDVEIYSGTRLATTGSRLEIGASNKFLREIFSGLADCASCREPVVLIFPDEEESTLREAFNRLSHFKSALSIIESKSPLVIFVLILMFYASDPLKVNSLLERLTATVPQKTSWSSLRSTDETFRSKTGDSGTPITNQFIANLEREVEVDIDTIGEHWSDLNAFLNSYFLRLQRPLHRQCRDLLRRGCRDSSFSR